MEDYELTFWMETIGGMLGLAFVFWYFIKPLLPKYGEFWQCEKCNKTFKNSKKCKSHEVKCVDQFRN